MLSVSQEASADENENQRTPISVLDGFGRSETLGANAVIRRLA